MKNWNYKEKIKRSEEVGKKRRKKKEVRGKTVEESRGQKKKRKEGRNKKKWRRRKEEEKMSWHFACSTESTKIKCFSFERMILGVRGQTPVWFWSLTSVGTRQVRLTHCFDCEVTELRLLSRTASAELRLRREAWRAARVSAQRLTDPILTHWHLRTSWGSVFHVLLPLLRSQCVTSHHSEFIQSNTNRNEQEFRIKNNLIFFSLCSSFSQSAGSRM